MSPLDSTESVGWFCVHTQAKHEHIAAAALRQDFGIEVFLPRIRFQRQTRQGTAWVTEALFLNYLFARFDLKTLLRQVQHARGVKNVVRFGDRWPAIPDSIIHDLRSVLGQEELQIITNCINPGDVVDISGGAFDGLQAVVTRVLPARQRVAVLLDFLGRQTSVEIPEAQLLVKREPRSFAG